MRTRVMLLAAVTAIGGAGLAATIAAGPAASAITNCDTNEAGLNAAEQEFLRLLNEERARAGAGPLVPSESLNRAAAWKSEDPSAYPPLFDHTDSLGRSTTTRVQDCGYPTWAGENIAYGFGSAASVLNGWMNSTKGHRENMLNKNFVVAGVGQHGSAWTLTLGAIDDSGAPRPTATVAPSPTPTPPRAVAKKVRLPGIARD